MKQVSENCKLETVCANFNSPLAATLDLMARLSANYNKWYLLTTLLSPLLPWTMNSNPCNDTKWCFSILFRCRIVEPAVHSVRHIHRYKYTYRVRMRVWLAWQCSTHPHRLWLWHRPLPHSVQPRYCPRLLLGINSSPPQGHAHTPYSVLSHTSYSGLSHVCG